MTDTLSKKQRSFNMSSIKQKDTKIEIEIRKALFHKGFRYRLHQKDLPGKPDIVFPKYKAVIFVNGCFWHYHECNLFKMPETRKEWWESKLTKNKERDLKNINTLIENGWKVLVIWECALRHKRTYNYQLLPDIITLITNWLIDTESTFKQIRG